MSTNFTLVPGKPPLIILPPTDIKANEANRIAMIIALIISVFLTYLPLRSFWRVKNIAAINICIILLILEVWQIINAFIWPNDDVSTWWNGVGICDIQGPLRYPITLALSLIHI